MARSFDKQKEDDDDKNGANLPSKNTASGQPILKGGYPKLPKANNTLASGGAVTDQNYLPTLPEPLEEIREDAEDGRHLFIEFLRDEIRDRGLCQPPCMLEDDLDLELTPERLRNWTRIGRELRQMADAFSRSKEREYVKHQAKEIALDTLNYDHFFLLLQELFQGGGITRERILVLFFFCADVAIEALKKGFHKTFHTLLQWSCKYIATRVAQWVHDHGGWGMVLQSSLAFVYQVSACCAFIAVAFACVVYIRRNVT